MSKKILFAANLDSFFIKFLIPQLKWFKEAGYEVHIAAKMEGMEIPYCDRIFNVDFARSLSLGQNLRSYKQMVNIIKNNHYEIISCHTPFGGAITRLAAKKCRTENTRIVYVAHGFHFYKGAPKTKYFLFYTAEKWLAKYTDEIITINLEDYEIAKNNFKTDVSYVAGVGLDTSKFDFEFNEEDKNKFRESLNLEKNDFVMIYPAELNHEKRQKWLIETLAPILKKNSHFKLLLPGSDSMNGACQELVSNLELDGQVQFLGFRRDIPQLIKSSDLAVTASSREGLPLNVMEAIYVGLPIVATACRGNSDLIDQNKNGFIIESDDMEDFRQKVLMVSSMSDEEKAQIKKYDTKVIEKYLIDNVLEETIKIYLKK